MGFLGSAVEAVLRICLPIQQTKEMLVRSLGWEDHLEEEMATHSSILAWGILLTEELGRLQSIGRKESDMREATEHAFILTN